MYNRIIDKLHEVGYTCKLEKVNNRAFNTEFFTSEIYKEVINYPENIELLNKEGFTSHSDFLRKGITNPNNALFVDTSDLKPSLEETINAIHSANGIAFLAHPFQYAVNDMETFLNELTSNYKIEGIECYHTTFSNEQSAYLLDYTKNKNLFVSGGSDYHGKNKKNHHLGVGHGNLNINKKVIDDWNK